MPSLPLTSNLHRPYYIYTERHGIIQKEKPRMKDKSEKHQAESTENQYVAPWDE